MSRNVCKLLNNFTIYHNFNNYLRSKNGIRINFILINAINSIEQFETKLKLLLLDFYRHNNLISYIYDSVISNCWNPSRKVHQLKRSCENFVNDLQKFYKIFFQNSELEMWNNLVWIRANFQTSIQLQPKF